MDTVKALFFKPDPAVQLRKCNALIRGNTRQLDSHLRQLNALESKTKNYVLTASKRSQNATNAQQRKQANADLRSFARELIRVRKQSARLATSRAQLNSVGLQVNEAFAMRRIQGSLKSSTGIMKDVNSLVRLPELTGTMRELSQELVKAGIIEEMTSDMMPESGEGLEEDKEAEGEIDQILAEVLKGKLGAAEKPQTEIPTPAAEIETAPMEEEDDPDAVLAGMRQRLEALKS